MIWLFASHRQAHYEQQTLKQNLDTGNCRIYFDRLCDDAATISIEKSVSIEKPVSISVSVSVSVAVAVAEPESESVAVAAAIAKPEPVSGARPAKLIERGFGQFVSRTRQ